jgi:hypothetical protein
MKKYLPYIFATLAFAWCFGIAYASNSTFERGQDLGMFLVVTTIISLIALCIGFMVKEPLE